MPSNLQINSLPTLELEHGEGLTHMAQVLAHRLRGLVASIEGFTDLLADTLITREQRELAWKILEGTSRIERVLADLQLYGEPLDPIRLPVRADEVLQDLFVPLSSEDRARIRVEDDSAGPLMLSGDPFLLRQAVLLLIQNALEATKKEGGVGVIVRRNGTFASFDVWNDGVISVDDAAQVVFIPFFTTKASNLGVGLTIARRIARLHNGSLELTANSREKGTQFSLHIPLAA